MIYKSFFQLTNSHYEYVTDIHGLWICEFIQFGWYLIICPTFSAHEKLNHINTLPYKIHKQGPTSFVTHTLKNILLMASDFDNSYSEKLPTCTFAVRTLFWKKLFYLNKMVFYNNNQWNRPSVSTSFCFK